MYVSRIYTLPDFLFKFTGQRKKDKTLRCWINVKMFGSDLSFLTCDDLHAYRRKLSLSTATVLVKLLKVRKCFEIRSIKV